MMGMAERAELSLQFAMGGQSVQCRVCPHFCLLELDTTGLCGVRANQAGQLVNRAYGRIVAQAVEPVEKKPFFHYHPGANTFSLGAAGCNLRCNFCQNWEIVGSAGPERDALGKMLAPHAAVGLAEKLECPILCFTFTEPAVNLEYVLDAAQLAKARGLKIVLATNGYLSSQGLRMLLPFLDAMKVDLKAPDDASYQSITGGRIQVVLHTIRAAREAGMWLELSSVLIPGLWDEGPVLERYAELVFSVAGPDVPWHLMRFFPGNRWAHWSVGDLDRLQKARQSALACGLRYVYLSNVPGLDENHTNCPACGSRLVSTLR